MKNRYRIVKGLWYAGVLYALLLGIAVQAAESPIHWRAWDEAQFTEAKMDSKLILLDLEAVWCHWCHVMDQTTYRDADVAAVIDKHFIPVKVDHDTRPDLAERYRDYGWPATIILDAEGRDVVKRAGYIEPDAMARLLQAVVKDPNPEAAPPTAPKSYASSALLDAPVRNELARRFIVTHDTKNGGLRQAQKFLDRDSVEYALLLARQGDKQARQTLRRDLVAGLNLIDPAWGGVYQYSTHGDWKHPHYEKLAFIQAAYLRLYAQAARVLGEPRYLKAARAIQGYVGNFLTSSDGLIYVSQDADLRQGEKAHGYFKLADSARRRLGIPRVDTHVYAKENGLMIAALAALYSASGERSDLERATTIARGMIAQRALADGGFSHDARDAAGPYLADTLAMGQGFLALYEVTGDREWLRRARAAADFIEMRFRDPTQPGYRTAVKTGVLTPVIQIDENIALTRFFNAVYRYSGRPVDKARSEYAMRYLATPDIALSRVTEAGTLLADFELSNDPAHFTIVGKKSGKDAQALQRAALGYPAAYRRVDWWDPQEGPMDNPDVQYPTLPRAAAFVCSEGRCSRPVYVPDDLRVLADQLSQPVKTKQILTLNPQ